MYRLCTGHSSYTGEKGNAADDAIVLHKALQRFIQRPHPIKRLGDRSHPVIVISASLILPGIEWQNPALGTKGSVPHDPKVLLLHQSFRSVQCYKPFPAVILFKVVKPATLITQIATQQTRLPRRINNGAFCIRVFRTQANLRMTILKPPRLLICRRNDPPAGLIRIAPEGGRFILSGDGPALVLQLRPCPFTALPITVWAHQLPFPHIKNTPRFSPVFC